MEQNTTAHLGVGEIIGGSFRIYGRRFGKIAAFLAILLVVNLIISGVVATLGSDLLELFDDMSLADVVMSGDVELMESYFEYLFTNPAVLQQLMSAVLPIWVQLYTWTLMMGLASALFVTPFVQGGICNVAMGDIHGVQDTAGGWMKQTGKFYGKLIATGGSVLLASIALAIGGFVALFLLIMLGVLFFNIGGGLGALLGVLLILALVVALLFAVLFLAAWFSQIYPVCAGEAVFGFSAIGRAFSLVKKRVWRSIGAVFLLSLITGVISWLVSWVLGALPLPFGTSSVLNQVAETVLTPISTIGACLLYLSIRMSEEGYQPFPQTEEVPAQPADTAPEGELPPVPAPQEPVTPAAENREEAAPAEACEEETVEDATQEETGNLQGETAQAPDEAGSDIQTQLEDDPDHQDRNL